MIDTLIFVHGWAGTPQAWQEQRKYFGKHYAIVTPDISSVKTIKEAARIVRDAAAGVDEAVLIGWSLGWLAILEALRLFHLNPVGLVSVCSTAKFLDDGYLGTGPTKTHLAKMMRDLARQPREVLENFYILCGLGLSQDKIDIQALLAGLEMLKTCDYREFITAIDIPTLLIAAKKDTICPAQASAYMHKLIKKSQLKIFDCGHAPFLSCDEFNSVLEDFIKNL